MEKREEQQGKPSNTPVERETFFSLYNIYMSCIFIYMSEKTVSVTPSVLLYPHHGGDFLSSIIILGSWGKSSAQRPTHVANAPNRQEFGGIVLCVAMTRFSRRSARCGAVRRGSVRRGLPRFLR
jgi:hypothetical protein